jgi:hypothetical protein
MNEFSNDYLKEENKEIILKNIRKEVGYLEDVFYSMVDDMKDILLRVNHLLKGLEN